MNAVKVWQEAVQFFMSMGPDHKGVINVSEPTEQLVGVILWSACFLNSSI
jgi:hypothetical protein